ncbi:MAG: hypothetical protein II154_05600 [Lachnospiraceae bacterium]|nr:hypothetical protein [Lachnospiraceae bacterium]
MDARTTVTDPEYEKNNKKEDKNMKVVVSKKSFGGPDMRTNNNTEELKEGNEGMGKTGMGNIFERVGRLAMNREEGLDGILVTIGLCIIALLLCVVMRDSLTEFIQTIVSEMTNSAKNILATAGTLVIPGVTL